MSLIKTSKSVPQVKEESLRGGHGSFQKHPIAVLASKNYRWYRRRTILNKYCGDGTRYFLIIQFNCHKFVEERLL